MVGRIRVRVQPGSSKNQILGFEGDVLRVKLTAPPVEGKANKALIAFLAEALGVRKSAVSIAMGHAGREKIVDVEGLDGDELRERLSISVQPGHD